MTKDADRNAPDIAKLTGQVLDLIFASSFDKAQAMIDDARARFPADQDHRLISLTATLENWKGNLDESIKLMRQALSEKPTWLPHLYELSVLLMDAEKWSDADTFLDELIRFSEVRNEPAFLTEARFRKIICLKALGRFDEIQAQKAKIPPNAEVFMDDGKYRLENL